MKVSAKQHIVLREPSLLDAIQTASLKWDYLTAKYYDSVDQVLKLRPYGLSWLLLYLEADPAKMEGDMERLTVSPEWRDLNWILFAQPAMAEEAEALKQQFTQIKRVLILPCSADDLEQVYTELLDPNDPPPKKRAAEKRQSQALPHRGPVPALGSFDSNPQHLLPPPRPPNFETNQPPPTPASAPSFSPVKMGAPVMPPTPQGLEKFINRAGSGVKVAAPGASPSPSGNGKPVAEKPPEKDLKELEQLVLERKLPINLPGVKFSGIDESLEGLFRIFPNVSDYTILNSEAQVTRSNSTEAAKTYATESALSMDVCVKIGEDFGFGTPVEIYQTGQTKTCAFFSVNPEARSLTQFRSAQVLARRGSNLTSLAAYLRKTL